MKSKIKSSAYLAASMIQQVKNTEGNKQLKLDDITRISFASCLNFFHTNSMFSPWPHGIFYSLDLHWVKRLGSDNYTHQQCWATTENGNSPSTMFKGHGTWPKTAAQLAQMHPDLVCSKDGDERLLIFCRYRSMNFTKSKLGFFLIEPKTTYSWNSLLVYKLVITPKPGLFPVCD